MLQLLIISLYMQAFKKHLVKAFEIRVRIDIHLGIDMHKFMSKLKKSV
jgi:hypothetical protein